MYKRIVVPLDGSHVAEEILPVVAQVAKAFNANVQLVSVIEEDVMAAVAHPLEGRFADQARLSALSIAEEYVKKTTSRLGLANDRVEKTVQVGNVPTVILAEAEKRPETLLAMSTHGRSGVQRAVLGSVADKLLHATKAPLLLYSPKGDGNQAAQKLTIVIVPLDGSELAEKVLPHVAALAKTLPLKITLCRVTSTMAENYGGEGFYTFPQTLISEMEKEAVTYLDGKIAEMEKLGCKNVEAIHAFGSASAQIVDLVRKTPGSFCAISTHGRSGLGRWVLGSVADRVIQQSGAPVLVIR